MKQGDNHQVPKNNLNTKWNETITARTLDSLKKCLNFAKPENATR